MSDRALGLTFAVVLWLGGLAVAIWTLFAGFSTYGLITVFAALIAGTGSTIGQRILREPRTA